MSDSHELPSRRDVLAKAGLASATSLAISLSGRTYATSSIGTDNQGMVEGIDPKNVFNEYERRGLSKFSDAELYQQAAKIISTPPSQGQTSFTLHAPLELMARYGLLPLVDPQQRSLARLQIVASASAFDAGGNPTAAPLKLAAFRNLSAAKKEFTKVFQSADADSLEAITLQIAAQFGTASLVHLLTPLALPTLTGASHSHIGLWLLLRHGTTSDVGDATLLRAGVRRLAENPELQLTSFSGMAISGTKPFNRTPVQIERDILSKLASPERSKRRGTGIQTLFEAGEKTGNADALFAEFIRHDLTNEQIDAAFRAVLRVCAHSMLQDDQQDAKFGWSHCLTLPQAACGLSSLNVDRKLALASTLVWIVSYRSVRSRQSLDFAWVPEKVDASISIDEALHTSPKIAAARVWHADASEITKIRRILATQASIRNDQHLAKYTRACFDLVSFDPTHRQLYLASAAHLGSLWIQERPHNKILDNLLIRRNTPN